MALSDLYKLIDERNEASTDAERDAIDDRIRSQFRRPVAVLISDMSGFSRVTKSLGIIHFLSMIRRMQKLCSPIIEANNGRLVKCEADNLFCSFPTTLDATRAAVEMRAAVAVDATERPESDQIGLAIGISWGEVLDIDGHDMFGHAVNMASKLGEDTAGGGEILLTQTAAAAVEGKGPWTFEEGQTLVSQLTITYLKLIGHD
jgi:class 3 adenylate cyclase